MDEQTLNKFKGFTLRATRRIFQENTAFIFVPDISGVVGLGIRKELTRTIDSPDFNVLLSKSAGQLANYVRDDNKVAVIKAQIAG